MYIVCFYHADRTKIDEYQYSRFEDAMTHYECYAHDESRMFRFISIMSYINQVEILVRMHSFSLNESINNLEVKDEELEIYRQQLTGKKVVLSTMRGEPHMKPQLCGTVNYVDDQYQVHMLWNNGGTLPLKIGIDDFEVLG